MTAPVMVTRKGGDACGSVHDQRGAEGRRPTLLAAYLQWLARRRRSREPVSPIIIVAGSHRSSTKLSPRYTKRQTAWLRHCHDVIEGRV